MTWGFRRCERQKNLPDGEDRYSEMMNCESTHVVRGSRRGATRWQPSTTPVFDAYWYFAAERQRIFHQRVRGERPPWTSDPVLSAYRFTNAYRAADRVSQYLIRKVAYIGDQAVDEVVFRVLLFKLFNKVATWELLVKAFGTPSARDFSVDNYDAVLTRAFGTTAPDLSVTVPPIAPSVVDCALAHAVTLRMSTKSKKHCRS